jgi:site-specific DNA recombinase
MLQPREYVLYLRKSKGRAGIPRQRRETTRYIEEDLGGRVVAEFVDIDTTAYAKPGQRARRDQYAAMLAFLRTDRREVPLGIAGWHTDRLNRSTADADELIEVAAEGGHIVETARAGTYDLSTATGRKRFRQDAVDAAYEVDHMTERIEAAKVEAAAEGEWLGGRRPFGYKADGVSHERAEARAIDAGADAVLAEVPVNQIRRDWAAAGLTGTGGAEFHVTAVRRILVRARNAGLMVHRGRVVGRAKWLPVLCAEKYRPPKGVELAPEVEEAWRAEAEEKWRAVVSVLGDPDRCTSPGPERRWLGSGIYLCGFPIGDGICGRPVKTGSAKGPRRRTVYRCSGEVRHVVRDAVILDDYVSRLLCARLARPDAATLLEGERDVDAPRLRAEKAALRGRLGELADMFTAGDIDGDQLKRGSARLKAQIAELDAQLEAVVHVSALDGIAGEPDAAEIWDGFDLHRRRAVLAAVVAVTILPAPRGRPRGHVKGDPYFHPEAVRLEWLG